METPYESQDFSLPPVNQEPSLDLDANDTPPPMALPKKGHDDTAGGEVYSRDDIRDFDLQHPNKPEEGIGGVATRYIREQPIEATGPAIDKKTIADTREDVAALEEWRLEDIGEKERAAVEDMLAESRGALTAGIGEELKRPDVSDLERRNLEEVRTDQLVAAAEDDFFSGRDLERSLSGQAVPGVVERSPEPAGAPVEAEPPQPAPREQELTSDAFREVNSGKDPWSKGESQDGPIITTANVDAFDRYIAQLTDKLTRDLSPQERELTEQAIAAARSEAITRAETALGQGDLTPGEREYLGRFRDAQRVEQHWHDYFSGAGVRADPGGGARSDEPAAGPGERQSSPAEAPERPQRPQRQSSRPAHVDYSDADTVFGILTNELGARIADKIRSGLQWRPGGKKD